MRTAITPTSRNAIPRRLKSESHFTTAGEQSGALEQSLGTETSEDLQQVYVDCRVSPHWADPVFGPMFRRWMSHLARELLRRGVVSILVSNAFGDFEVQVNPSAA